MLGTFALWFGWYGFNPGSTLSMHDKEMGALAAQVAMSSYENTSTLVAAGPVVLDTGQQAAKFLSGDPFWVAESNVKSGGRGRARVRWRLGQVGIPSLAAGPLSALVVCHDWMRGTRIGEASNPGPSGGGSRATARRRDEMDVDEEQGGGFGDLAGMLRPLIEQVLREVLRDLLGGQGMKQMLAGLLTGGLGTATSRPSTVAPSVGEAATDGNVGKGERWKKRRKLEESGQPKGKGKADDGQSKGKGKNASEIASGKGKNASEAVPGKGKNAGEAASGKGKNASEAAQGKGKNAGQAVQGKGRNAGGEPDGAGSWETVPSKKWALRPEDWSAPLMSYDELLGAFAKGGGAAIKAVALVTEEELETLCTMLRGATLAHAVLLVALDKESQQRCPGVCGHRLLFRTVRYHTSHTAGLVPPQPKAVVAKQKIEPKASSVLYIRYYQKYMSTDRWKDVKKNPQHEFHAFLAQHRLRALDSWGWMVEDVPRTSMQRIYGCTRVLDCDVATLMALSGKGGVFIDASRSFKLGPVQTEWHDQLDSETPGEYLNRLLTVPCELGLVAGFKQLGKRLRRDPDQPVLRHWMVDGIPREVGVDQLGEVLKEAGFDELDMTIQRRRGALMEYHFRARANFAADSIAIPLTVGDSELALWVRISPPKRGRATPQTISTAGSWTLAPPRSRWSTEKVAVDVDGEKEKDSEAGPVVINVGEDTSTDESMKPAAQQGASQEDATAAAKGKDGAAEPKTASKDHKRGTAPAGSSAKRVVVQQRALPSGVELIAQPTDGSCLFHCLAAGLKQLDPSKEYTAAEIRARVANHFAKNAGEYQKCWDGELPNRQISDDFKQYISAIEKEGTWGGILELRAASRIYDTRLIVFATPVEIEPFHLHGQQKKRVIALRFNGRHYDLLKGTGGKLPKDILEIKGRPEEVPQRFRGGGDDASVWTRSSACSSGSRAKSVPLSRAAPAASVWTRSSNASVRASVASPGTSAATARASSVGDEASGERCGMRTSGTSRRPASVASHRDWPDDVPRLEEGAPPRRKRRMNHTALLPDGTYKEPCSYCAFVHVAATSSQLNSQRWNHHNRWHKGLPRTQGRGLRRGVALREVGHDEQADWRCPMPLCSVGLAAGDKAKVSQATLRQIKEEHRRRAHRHLTREQFVSRSRGAAHRLPAARMRCRIGGLNRHRAKRVSAATMGPPRPSPQDFISFTWPQVLRNSRAKTDSRCHRWRITMASAWRCRHCMGCWRHARVACGHRCADVVDRSAVRAAGIQKMRRIAAKIGHGIDQATLDQTFASALECLTRPPQ